MIYLNNPSLLSTLVISISNYPLNAQVPTTKLKTEITSEP